MATTLRTLLLRGVLPVALGLASAACGDGKRQPGTDGDIDHQPPPVSGSCLQPTEGCPCAKEGAVVSCGVTVSKQKDTLTCREGERSCIDGEWSECLGEKLTQIYSPPVGAPGVKTQGLDTTAGDCGDKCEPYCRTLADTPEDLAAGNDFTADEAGLSLKGGMFTGGNCPQLTVTPPTKMFEITDINTTTGAPTPPSTAFQARCAIGNALITPTWSIDQPDRSYIAADGTLNLFTAIAGDIKVTAKSAINSAMATVTVKVNVNLVDANAADVATDFNGVGTVDDVGTLYPYKNTVFPLDLSPPVVQWKQGGVTIDSVQVALRYPAGSATPSFWYSRIYDGEPKQGPLIGVNSMGTEIGPAGKSGSAPAWAIPEKVWTALGRTTKNLGTTPATRTADIVIQRRRTDGTLYKEMVVPVTFSSEALRGTVYYMQYERRLYKPGNAADLASEALYPCSGMPCTGGQPDFDYANFDPFNASASSCPVGNETHSAQAGGSTVRAIDMSTPSATISSPFGNTGCPVCHSVSAQGNRLIAGSRFLQTWPSALPANASAGGGLVRDISRAADGTPTFTPVGEAPNYSEYPTASAWGSRGFAFAALTPNGALALQGPGWWGNTNQYSGTTPSIQLQQTSVQQDGSQNKPMFFVPTVNAGTSVKFATTAAIAGGTRYGNILAGVPQATLPNIDGISPAVNDAVLVKNQANAVDNGVYTVTSKGSTATNAKHTVTASSASSVYTAGNSIANAFDGNATSRWESAYSDPQWIQADLGLAMPINRVDVNWESASGKSYTIAYSNDGTTWTTFITVTNNTTGDRTDSFTTTTNTATNKWTAAGAVTGRYVRLTGTARNTAFGYSIEDFSIYGSPTWLLTRRLDADSDAGVASTTDYGVITGNFEVRVTRGTANYAKVFRLDSATAPTINSSALTFTDLFPAASIPSGSDYKLPVMSMPTISPMGDKIAYVNGDADAIPMKTDTGWRKGLTMINFNATSRLWSNKKRIVNNWVNSGEGGVPIKWPFFEHDNNSIVFVETTTDEYCRSGGSTANNPDKACYGDGLGFANTAPTQRAYWAGRLYSANTSDADPAKVELATLNNAEQTADAGKAYQPTVLPFVSGGYRWVIFTSPRAYGNQLNQVATNGQATNFTCASTMLWVAALDNTPSAAADRSHPAFLLPGQSMDLITKEYHHINERGYLVPSVCKPTGTSCTTTDECCNTDQCLVQSVDPMTGIPSKVCKAANSCQNAGGDCLSNSDCCGMATCVAQKCVSQPAFAQATYERIYVADCEAGFQPLWGDFSYHVTVNGGSHIEFSARTAATSADLATATTVAMKDATMSNYGMTADGFDVGTTLVDQTISPYLPYLKIIMHFVPGTGGAYSPILHDWEQRFSCVPAE